MIELLVVIAIIGILAVAVLSAINPIEQINKGRDTGRRSDAGELIGAIDRYYASISYYPWDTSNNYDPSAVDWVNVGSGWYDNGGTDLVLDKLIDTNEIKPGLSNRLQSYSGQNTLKAYFAGGNTSSFYVCFLPASYAFQKEAYDRCQDASRWGQDSPYYASTNYPCGTECTASTMNGCYICLP